MLKIAVLDDYANASLSCADWSDIERRADVTIFNRYIAEEDLVATLAPFDIICLLRERTAMPAAILRQLPQLKAIILSDAYIRVVDRDAAAACGIAIVDGQPPEGATISPHDTAEFVWGLIIATVRHIPQEVARLRQGQWQQTLGMSLAGRTLGIAGLGRTGAKVAEYARAFDMKVIAWSANLTEETAARHGVERVDKDMLFRRSDVVTIHYALGDRSRGLVGAREIDAMKPTAYLINTSRGPIVDEQALLSALREKRIAGAALDVFDREPLPGEHPFLALDNVVATPHLGFVTDRTMGFYHASIASTLGNYLRQTA
ncbi:D-2-hydroxyacid dehydrogenase family protein (plasmid) [Rhizorhabdus wittichii]|uniref:D-2-hydroxyacid dehydrogenase family protein n=1 Tax=Rhizorhabdus wittichii TaxID=160791 RepID=A0A975D8M0_9SPHN|nr:D-2-hydroxyacid dehydrogenase family protein [Rhizorhabdus wittichii]QTH24981.1 D-2-hydroxyacid dehydrogenase family protein [Rhizorhabdus wittichii]